jgi:hypothetical protein
MIIALLGFWIMNWRAWVLRLVMWLFFVVVSFRDESFYVPLSVRNTPREFRSLLKKIVH